MLLGARWRQKRQEGKFSGAKAEFEEDNRKRCCFLQVQPDAAQPVLQVLLLGICIEKLSICTLGRLEP